MKELPAVESYQTMTILLLNVSRDETSFEIRKSLYHNLSRIRLCVRCDKKYHKTCGLYYSNAVYITLSNEVVYIIYAYSSDFG